MESLRNQWDAADLLPVSNGEGRGASIKRRFDALGISHRTWMTKTGIDIKTLERAIDPELNTRESSYLAIESALSSLEDAVGGKPSIALAGSDDDPGENLIEFRLSGNFGVSVVVKGPMDNRAEVEESALRLLREIRAEKPPQ